VGPSIKLYLDLDRGGRVRGAPAETPTGEPYTPAWEQAYGKSRVQRISNRENPQMRKSNNTTETAPEEVTGETSPEWLSTAEEATEVVNTTGEVMAVPTTFSREDLSSIATWEDALRLAQSEYGTIVTAEEEIGDGFRVATEDEERRLVGVPLFLLEWTFRAGDFGDDYVSIRAIAQGENGAITKWIINDGGTGICRDLRDFTKKTGRLGGLRVKNGLRVSDYQVDNDTKQVLSKTEYKQAISDGRKTFPGYTFYLDTSA
jgi:hypothetical protein